MAKTKAAKRKSTQTWSGADHSSRTAKRIASLHKKQRKKLLASEPIADASPQQQRSSSGRGRLASHVPADTYKRTHLAHDNQDKIELSKLRLATSQMQRQVNALKERLEKWDPEDVTNSRVMGNGREEIEARMKLDAENRRMDREARGKAKAEQILIEAERGVNCSVGRRKANLRKKPRPGPETWKLRGAARPAWEVYDFDTRYVDPHLKAMEEHREKVKRSINVFNLCRGRFAKDEDDLTTTECNGSHENNSNGHLFSPPQPHCRTYLSLLSQLGSLHLCRKNYSSARSTFLSAIELEGYTHPHSITNARYQLMNMYLSTNRPTSARKLCEALSNDKSAWICYSAALIEFVSWNISGEDGSTENSAELALARAIQGNVYVAYMLGWKDVFEKAMEYVEDVVEWADGKAGSIMEAVEYYGCGVEMKEKEDEDKGMALWLATEGSLDWLRSFVLRVLNGNRFGDEGVRLKSVLLSWETMLAKEEEAYEQERSEKTLVDSDDIMNSDDNQEDEEPDLLMYAGMFRTAMNWLQDAGEFKEISPDNFTHEVENDKKDPSNTVLKSEAQSISGDSDSTDDSDSGSEEETYH